MHRATLVLLFATVALALAAPLLAAPSGKVVFVSNRTSGDRELYVVNPDGSALRRLTFNTLVERQPAWSPDHRRIAFSAFDPAPGNWDIYSIDSSGGDLRRLTTDPARDDAPQWTADGRVVYQHGALAGPATVWIVNADGSGAHQLPTGSGNAITPSASPQGSAIAFASDRAEPGVWAIYTMRLNGQALRQITFPEAGVDAQPRFSPSGNDIVFIRDNGTADNDLYLVHANGQQQLQLTNTPNRIEFLPSWASDDRLVFTAFDENFFASLSTRSIATGADEPLTTVQRAPFTENFDGGVLDSSLWHTISDPGGSIGPQDGRLLASISGAAVPGGPFNQIDEHVGSQCSLKGDFDVQVDYSLLTWPQFGGVAAALQAFFGSGGISRTSGPWTPPYNQQYVGYTDSGADAVNTFDTAGSLRLVREGGTLSAYERGEGRDWTLVTRGSAPNPVTYGVGLTANGDQFAHQDTTVAFDNLQLSSGVLSCPEWWEDFNADAY
jgi:hypothetical protein